MHQVPGKGNPKGGPRKRPHKWTGQEAPTKTHKGKDGKGNGKGRKGAPPLPKELIDLKGHALTAEGKSICFAYNLKECKRSGCPHQHVCARCFGSHPIRQCTAAS